MNIRLFVKLMMFAVVLAIAGPFFLKGPDGKPLMNPAEIPKSIFVQLESMKPDFNSSNDKNEIDETLKPLDKHEVYKWQDEDGLWHYSNIEPENQQVRNHKCDSKYCAISNALKKRSR